jgi:hypothetical protein
LLNLSAGVFGAPQELRRTQRHFLGVVFLLDAIPAAFLAQVFAKKSDQLRSKHQNSTNR